MVELAEIFGKIFSSWATIRMSKVENVLASSKPLELEKNTQISSYISNGNVENFCFYLTRLWRKTKYHF
jgi:hypothetical protein